MQAYIDTLHATRRESNLTTAMLQNICTFDWQDSSKLEDWFMDMETATDILTESCTLLAKSPAHSSVRPPKQGSARMKSKASWDWNSAMQISTLIPQDLWRPTKKTMTLAVYAHCFKTAAKHCAFDDDTVAICIFVKGLRDTPTMAYKIFEKDPQTLAEVIRLVEKHTNWELH